MPLVISFKLKLENLGGQIDTCLSKVNKKNRILTVNYDFQQYLNTWKYFNEPCFRTLVLEMNNKSLIAFDRKN